jgi:hypothetical protein
MNANVLHRYLILPGESYRIKYLALSIIQKSQVEQIRLWRNKKISVLRQNEEINELEQEIYFQKFVFSEFQKNEPTQILFAIENNGEFIGYGGLVHIDWNFQIAEISFLLDPDIQEDSDEYKNVFKDFLEIIQVIAFKELNIQKLFTETFDFRIEHISILNSVNFKFIEITNNTKKINGVNYGSFRHEKLREIQS